MDWSRASVSEVDGAIDRLRSDLAAQTALEGDAIAARERALGAVDSANALIERCRQQAKDDANEIDKLLDERSRLTPRSIR